MKQIIYELRNWNQMKDDPRSCERNLRNCVKKPEKNSILQRIKPHLYSLFFNLFINATRVPYFFSGEVGSSANENAIEKLEIRETPNLLLRIRLSYFKIYSFLKNRSLWSWRWIHFEECSLRRHYCHNVNDIIIFSADLRRTIFIRWKEKFNLHSWMAFDHWRSCIVNWRRFCIYLFLKSPKVGY